MRWAVTFSLAKGLRTFRVYAPNPVEAEDRARLLLAARPTRCMCRREGCAAADAVGSPHKACRRGADRPSCTVAGPAKMTVVGKGHICRWCPRRMVRVLARCAEWLVCEHCDRP